MIPLLNNKLHKAIPVLAAVATFLMVVFGADAIRKTENDRYLSDLEKHKKAAQIAIQQSEQTGKVVTDLEKQVTVLVSQNKELESKLSVEKRRTNIALGQVTETKDSLKVATTLADSNVVLTQIVEHQDVVITSQAAEILVLESQKVNLTSQIDIKDSVNTLLEADNKRLKDVVEKIPPVNKCVDKFFFCKLNKPSRTTSFIGGVVATLAGLVVVK